jgi:hypothetical protein
MSFLNQFILPLAVLVSASGTIATATFAWKLYDLTKVHDRALFGSEVVDGHDGIVSAVNENTEMTDQHRQVLHKHDLIGDRPLYRSMDSEDDGRA